MISAAAYSYKTKELKIIEQISGLEAAKRINEKWSFNSFMNMDKLKDFLKNNGYTDIICFDITENDGVEKLLEVRRSNEHSLIMLVAAADISPIRYMKPSIMAASIMLSPLDSVQVREAFGEVFETLKNSDETDSKKVMVIKSHDGNLHIDLDDIFYFEAREKKIFAAALAKEYAFYDTLDSLMKRLPDNFKRSHKGFIVNCNMIRKVSLSKNEIELEQNRFVPLSRTYKKDFKL